MPAYPGLGLPLRHNPQRDYGHYPIGAHGSNYGADSDILPVRELAMMSTMEQLTDKEEWHKKVFDDKIVSKWRDEALAIPDEHFWQLATRDKMQRWDEQGQLTLQDDFMSSHVKKLKGIMNEATFDCCVAELRSKAKYFEESSIIPTLDACASIAKSDKLVSSDLQAALRTAFDVLGKHHSSAPDWHPNTNDMVQDLVHPSLYPLIYGRSRVLQDEAVGVSDAIDKWAGKGEIIAKEDLTDDHNRNRFFGVGGGEVPPQYWSDTFQWLPANVAFEENGSVKFTSYINNLHPNKFPDIYRTIERLIEAALPAWDQCLAIAAGYEKREGAGRLASRFPYPDYPDDDHDENWTPSDHERFAHVEVDWESVRDEVEYDPECHDENEQKWKLFRSPLIPEPIFKDIEYAQAPEKRLATKFKETGLQVIVKMASIELTPEKPEFPVGGWHIEGQMNEHICGTALYYLDSDNITPSSLSFRMQTSAYLNDEITVGQDSYSWLEQVYGTALGGSNSPCLQNYGSVETCAGRMLTFPNVFQHRVSSFRLKDPSKPGHRKFIALWLVDPTKRIISTANVPPQQIDWWLDAVLGSTTETRKDAFSKLPAEIVSLIKDKGMEANMPARDEGQLPPELMEMIREYFNADAANSPMGLTEAREHRLKLMEERGAFVKTSEKGWQQHSYSFCEH